MKLKKDTSNYCFALSFLKHLSQQAKEWSMGPFGACAYCILCWTSLGGEEKEQMELLYVLWDFFLYKISGDFWIIELAVILLLGGRHIGLWET